MLSPPRIFFLDVSGVAVFIAVFLVIEFYHNRKPAGIQWNFPVFRSDRLFHIYVSAYFYEYVALKGHLSYNMKE